MVSSIVSKIVEEWRNHGGEAFMVEMPASAIVVRNWNNGRIETIVERWNEIVCNGYLATTPHNAGQYVNLVRLLN